MSLLPIVLQQQSIFTASTADAIESTNTNSNINLSYSDDSLLGESFDDSDEMDVDSVAVTRIGEAPSVDAPVDGKASDGVEQGDGNNVVENEDVPDFANSDGEKVEGGAVNHNPEADIEDARIALQPARQRAAKRNSSHLSRRLGYNRICKVIRLEDRPPTNAEDHPMTTAPPLPPPLLRKPPVWFHSRMSSDCNPTEAADCITGVLHISSSNSDVHYHYWVTDSALVPSAKQHFAKSGFNAISFITYRDRDRYNQLYSSRGALLCQEDLRYNPLFRAMDLVPNAGVPNAGRFHPGVLSPKEKRTTLGRGSIRRHGKQRRGENERASGRIFPSLSESMQVPTDGLATLSVGDSVSTIDVTSAERDGMGAATDANANANSVSTLQGVDEAFEATPNANDDVVEQLNDDMNGENNVDESAALVDAVAAPGVGEVEAPSIEPFVVGVEGREVSAANLSQALVESRARDDSGNVVSKIMFSILQTARI